MFIDPTTKAFNVLKNEYYENYTLNTPIEKFSCGSCPDCIKTSTSISIPPKKSCSFSAGSKDIQANDFDLIRLLANAYTNAGSTDKAIAAWQLIIDNMPDTDYSSYASGMIQQLGGTVKESSSGQSASGAASDGTTDSTEGTAETGTDTAGTDTDTTGTGTDITDTTETGTDTAGTVVENGYGG